MALTRDQWLIYGDEELEGVVRALETEALGVLANYFIRTGDFDRKRIGGILMRIANMRREINLGKSPVDVEDGRRSMMEKVVVMLNPDKFPGDRVQEATNDIHAALTHLDTRLKEAGTTGPGLIRGLGRGD